MRPVDILGLGPSYNAVKLQRGGWQVTVTPPAFTELPPQSIELTEAEYAGFQRWRNGGALIQNALPHLSPSQREILMTGIGDEDFKRVTAEDD